MHNFRKALQYALNGSKNNFFTDNWDYRRFGPEMPVSMRQRVKFFVLPLLRKLGFPHKTPIDIIKDNEEKFEWLYENLVDDESREILVRVLAYRVLGYRKVKLPLNTPDFWSKLDELDRQSVSAEKLALGFLDWSLSKLDLHAEGYPILLFIRPSGVFTQLLLEQYRCQAQDQIIEVEAGDTVIDAGGCYGDTALYFAHKSGPDGQVFSFEFMPDNVAIFKRNLELNHGLAGRIQIMENPLWSSSGERLFIEGKGPAAHITPNPKALTAKQAETMSIDDLVNAKSLSKVDFIKMDIEGAELEALKGARETLGRHRPKLAISIYHKLEDFWEIPQWIDGLGLGYRFYLRHFTIHAEETVLFAFPA